MKLNIKRLISVLIMASLVLSLVACGETDETPIIYDDHEGVIARAQVLKNTMSHALPDLEVTEKLKILSWYDIDEKTPTPELFKAKYGIPNQKDEDDQFVFDLERVAYEARYERLVARIASNNSPDMIPFEERFFPWGVHKNLYDTIDGVIDLSGSEWDATRGVIELFKWGGKNYAPVTQLENSTSLLFYRKTVMNQEGFQDPYQLFLQGKWDWDAFEGMLKDFTNPSARKYGVMGFYIDEATILTTGVPMIGIVDGKLQNNMNHGSIERAMAFLKRLADNDYRYPYHTINEFRLNYNAFRSGEILFWNDGPWEWQQRINAMAAKDDWPENDIGIVPWPRDPRADDYYQRGKQDALMLVAGSQNHNGYIAWTQSAVIAAQDKVGADSMSQQGRLKMKRDHDFTDEIFEALDKILELTVVWDFKNGIGEDVSDGTRDSNVENLTKPVITDGVSFNEMREAERGVIEARIEEINAGVS
jgi:multiple sugar transport system substrate-binding protein